MGSWEKFLATEPDSFYAIQLSAGLAGCLCRLDGPHSRPVPDLRTSFPPPASWLNQDSLSGVLFW